jgi:RHS repeat-associated protein
VRQLANAGEQVTLAQSFDPFGVPFEASGSGESDFAYTGEWYGSYNELLFLRARYYDPYLNRFISPDTIIPDFYNPQSLNDYTYVLGNPVNHVDPSGQHLAAILGQAVNRSEPDPRDLTDWLYREMIDNAKDPTVRRLKAMNWLAEYLADAVICDVAQAIAMADWSDIPVGLMMSYALVANRDPAIAATVLHGVALYEYSQLVKDGAIYDFKDETGIKLGPGITLCAGACYNDIEYSVPGNIHFAYIGGAAGIPGWEIQAGAGYAEVDDPAHDRTSNQYSGDYEFPPLGQMIGRTPWDPSTLNFGDDPKDHEAVTLGIKLWENYEDRMTRAQFENELSSYISRLSRCAPNAEPVKEEYTRDWPYPVGYFNNKGNQYKLPSNRCP